MTILSTERLVIRCLQGSDLGELSAIQAESEVMSFFPNGIRSTEQTALDIERCQAFETQFGYSPWAVVAKESGRLIGRCGLIPQEIGGNPEVELTYLFGAEYWGMGYATEAAGAVKAHALAEFGLARVVSLIHVNNIASRRVAEKIGMKRERLVQFLDMKCWLYASATTPKLHKLV